MNTLDIACPSCGNPSHLSEAKAHSRASITTAFKCSNAGCRKQFSGVLTLAAGIPAGTESFSNGREPENKLRRQSAPPMFASDGTLLTDC